MKILERFFPVKKQRLSEDIERALAEKGLERQRRALAENEQTSQEILYFLAESDESAKVRRAVAANPSTPLQAAPILAKDKDTDVRLILAHRLVKVLPNLSQDKYSQLYAFAVQSLGMLALDEVLKIRRALTETLKDHAHTPPAVAAQLARALEREVSEPILRFCAALADEDIVDILKSHPADWAAEAVAARQTVSTRVSQAVIDTGNRRAGAILLSNAGADMDLPLLEAIVERAREYPEWHKPLATRKALPPLMAMKLSAYVDSTIKKILLERSDLDAVTIGEITAIVKRRTAYEAQNRDGKQEQDAFTRAKAFHHEHGITEDSLGDAIAMRDDGFVIACLAILAKTTPENVQKIFDVRAPKSICALVWKAGLSMRFALRLQQTLGRVPPSSLIYPRFGTDYPFPEDEMEALLRVIGV